jgi:hypothetical protein
MNRKQMTRTIVLLIANLLMLTANITGQDSKEESKSALPDRWRGLILNQSTPDDAIRILGNPAEDKVDRIRVFQIDRWVTSKQKEKIFRKLLFKKPEGVDKATLSFLENKLVMIEIDTSKEKPVSPNAIANVYGIEFYPMVSALSEALYPDNFERNQGRVYPKEYPTFYHLVSVSKNSFISAGIGNVPSLGGAFARSAGVKDQAGSFPGKVEYIQIISRKLENRDGADVLK